MVTGGPMLSGKWRAEELGSGTDAWRLWAERRAGRLTDEELCEAESCMSRSSGHCMVMGTASTMASVVEALGMTRPGNAGLAPARDGRDGGSTRRRDGARRGAQALADPHGAGARQRDLHRRIDDQSVAIDENSVLVLKQVGPRGAPGMPEWGAAPIPARLLKRGVKDMVRISDARMSGTSYGTVVLHVAPESAIGGPLALVRDGDEIELNVPRRSLTLRVSDDELARRKAAWKPRPPHFTRGYGKLFLDPCSRPTKASISII
jgi:dihydroxyacid dehydratase/phosphogluconate dehydratase